MRAVLKIRIHPYQVQLSVCNRQAMIRGRDKDTSVQPQPERKYESTGRRTQRGQSREIPGRVKIPWRLKAAGRLIVFPVSRGVVDK